MKHPYYNSGGFCSLSIRASEGGGTDTIDEDTNSYATTGRSSEDLKKPLSGCIRREDIKLYINARRRRVDGGL
jgi:hypothetical protein